MSIHGMCVCVCECECECVCVCVCGYVHACGYIYNIYKCMLVVVILQSHFSPLLDVKKSKSFSEEQLEHNYDPFSCNLFLLLVFVADLICYDTLHQTPVIPSPFSCKLMQQKTMNYTQN